MKVLAVLLPLFLGRLDGRASDSITITEQSCDNCDITREVSNNQDNEINVDVIGSGLYIQIMTEVKPGVRTPVVFVLRTEFSVKTWRIPSLSSGHTAWDYSARLLPTNSTESNMKLIVSTKSQGKLLLSNLNPMKC